MSDLFSQGDVISYSEMCSAVGTNLQRGMNFRLGRFGTVVLMSRRPNAPYRDQVDEGGHSLFYEGHDRPKRIGAPNPKSVDQPEKTPKGTLTQNGLFLGAVRKYKELAGPPERVLVFEKILDGVWVFNGAFELIDAWTEESDGRSVFKFHLRLLPSDESVEAAQAAVEVDDDRVIPSKVKQIVWKRDGGCCRVCKSNTKLHFDHIIPYSRGGSSKDPENIQILCGRHNLQKHDRIE